MKNSLIIKAQQSFLQYLVLNNNNKVSKNNYNFFSFSEKFINFLMINGKKSKAYSIFYLTLNLLKIKLDHVLASKNLNISTLSIILVALNNVKPSLDVRKVRVAGTTYQVPTILSKKKQYTLAIRWIIESARKRKKLSKNTISECLAQELFDAYNKQGYARLKRDELHKIAELNRAYLRYRWW